MQQRQRMAPVAGLLDGRDGLLATADFFCDVLLRPAFRFAQTANLQGDLGFRPFFIECRSKDPIMSQSAQFSLEISHRCYLHVNNYRSRSVIFIQIRPAWSFNPLSVVRVTSLRKYLRDVVLVKANKLPLNAPRLERIEKSNGPFLSSHGRVNSALTLPYFWITATARRR